MHLEPDEAMRRAMAADHGARHPQPPGAPDLVPACFAIVDDWLAIPVDSVKPKGSTALGRIRNLERDPRATLLVEQWDARRLVAPVVGPAVARSGRRRAGPRRTASRSAFERAIRSTRPTTFVAVLTFRIEHVGGWEARWR